MFNQLPIEIIESISLLSTPCLFLVSKKSLLACDAYHCKLYLEKCYQNAKLHITSTYKNLFDKYLSQKIQFEVEGFSLKCIKSVYVDYCFEDIPRKIKTPENVKMSLNFNNDLYVDLFHSHTN